MNKLLLERIINLSDVNIEEKDTDNEITLYFNKKGKAFFDRNKTKRAYFNLDLLNLKDYPVNTDYDLALQASGKDPESGEYEYYSYDEEPPRKILMIPKEYIKNNPKDYDIDYKTPSKYTKVETDREYCITKGAARTRHLFLNKRKEAEHRSKEKTSRTSIRYPEGHPRIK
jgi:hypothetical protein